MYWRRCLGALYCELGQAEKAMRAFERALRIRPDSVDALCGLGQAAAMAGDRAVVDRVRRALEGLDRRMLERFERWLEPSRAPADGSAESAFGRPEITDEQVDLFG